MFAITMIFLCFYKVYLMLINFKLIINQENLEILGITISCKLFEWTWNLKAKLKVSWHLIKGSPSLKDSSKYPLIWCRCLCNVKNTGFAIFVKILRVDEKQLGRQTYSCNWLSNWNIKWHKLASIYKNNTGCKKVSSNHSQSYCQFFFFQMPI